MADGRSVAVTIGAVVVVVIETGSDAVEVVVDTVWAVVAAAWVAAATRIQHLTPRLRPRAPSTSTVLVILGLLI